MQGWIRIEVDTNRQNRVYIDQDGRDLSKVWSPEIIKRLENLIAEGVEDAKKPDR